MPLTTVNPGLLDTQAQYTGFKNRIFNGQMQIDQRNNGASINVTNTAAYPVDRFIAVTSASTTVAFQRSTVAPAGFTNSLIATVTTPKSMAAADLNRIIYRIEGLNVSDLGFGTANAQPITLSFWVRSSIIGTYNITFIGGQNYLASYTISAANTWEYKTISISGSTTGTWPTDNTTGLEINFTLGAGSDWVGTAGSWISSTARFAVSGAANFIGTNGATFYITGVQLEKGSTATSFDYRPYGTEEMLCKRYYNKFIANFTGGNGTGGIIGSGAQANTTAAWVYTANSISMRATPTLSFSGLIISDSINFDVDVSAINLYGNANSYYLDVVFVTSVGAANRPVNLRGKLNVSNAFLALSSEL